MVYFNVDFLWMSTKPPQGIFGNPNAQTYVRQERDFINSTSGSSSAARARARAREAVRARAAWTAVTSQLLQDQGFITNTPAYFASLANYYNALDLGTLGNLITEGGRFQVGFWNPDNSGFDARFWFGGQASDNFNAADDETQRPKDMAGFEQILRFLQNNNLVNLGLAGESVDAIQGRLTVLQRQQVHAKSALSDGPAKSARIAGRRQHGAAVRRFPTTSILTSRRPVSRSERTSIIISRRSSSANGS